jgi:hypothetical protein
MGTVTVLALPTRGARLETSPLNASRGRLRVIRHMMPTLQVMIATQDTARLQGLADVARPLPATFAYLSVAATARRQTLVSAA